MTNKVTDELLKDAIKNDELLFFYQPILSLRSGRIEKVEALIRWRHNEDLIPPKDFIPIAERSNLITAITNHMIPHFISDLKTIQQIDSSIGASMNVSAQDLEAGTLCTTLLENINEQGVECRTVTLEITEATALTQTRKTSLALAELVANDIRIAMDDFGTGESTFEKLRNLPFDILKIDHGITASALGSRDALTVLDHTINLAHQLKLEAVVEGVEIEAQLLYLRGTGCDYIQGYLFSHPLELSDLVEFLKDPPRRNVSSLGGIYKAKIDYCDWVRQTIFIITVGNNHARIIDYDSSNSRIDDWLRNSKKFLKKSSHSDIKVSFEKSKQIARLLVDAVQSGDVNLVSELMPEFLQSTSDFNTRLHELYVSEFMRQLADRHGTFRGQ